MSNLALRDYQTECIDATFTGLRDHQRVVNVLPTGSGKTVIFAHLTGEWVHDAPDKRALILVHRDELVRQTVSKIKAVTGITPGVEQADQHANTADAIVVASVQSLSRESRLTNYLRQVGNCRVLVVVDEAHHAVADSYRKILNAVSGPAVGFTATLMRSDDLGLGDVWQTVTFQRTIKWMIEKGWLVDVRGKSVPVDDLDLNAVKTTAGDLQSGDLGAALTASMALETTAKAYVEQASDRLGVAFWPTVETAEAAVGAFDEQGLTSAVVTGTTPHEERQHIYAEQAHGRIRVVHNCMVLTEGWDSPPVSCCVVGRPTSSTGLYIQMVGRVLRPWPQGGKRDALVLDVTGAARRNSLATLGVLTETPERDLFDGESLMDYEIAIAEEKQDLERKIILKSTMVDVDLFAASTTSWLQTTRGIWFINVREGYFFLYEERDDSGYTIGWAPKTGKSVRLSDVLPLEMAIAVGEQHAMDADPSLASKTSSWRRRKAPASEAQCRVLGVDYPAPELSKQEASNMISIKFASQRLDRWAPR
jgi:superfamily II DNA or RNA helicase